MIIATISVTITIISSSTVPAKTLCIFHQGTLGSWSQTYSTGYNMMSSILYMSLTWYASTGRDT